MTTPHPLNPNYEQHPDWGIRLLENISLNAVKRHIKATETILGVPLRFVLNTADAQYISGFKENIFNNHELGASYSMLPVFLMLDTQSLFQTVMYPTALYPIGFAHSPTDMTRGRPVLDDLEHFSSLPYILDYAVERFIHHEAVKSLLPLSYSEYGDYDLYHDKRLQEILQDTVTALQVQNVTLSLNESIQRYQTVFNDALTDNLGTDLSMTADRLMQIPKNTLKIQHLMELGFPSKNVYHLRVYPIEEVEKNSKPQFSATERIAVSEADRQRADFTQSTQDIFQNIVL